MLLQRRAALRHRQRAVVAARLPRRRAAAGRRARARGRHGYASARRAGAAKSTHCPPHSRRPLSLVAESDLNDARLVTAREAGGYGLAAQWNDDFHHALHAMLTGEEKGYLRRLRRPGDVRQSDDAGLRSRRNLVVVPSTATRTPGRCRTIAGVPLRRLCAGSRPDRQQVRRRSPVGDAVATACYASAPP